MSSDTSRHPLRIGLTGGVASGKSTVARMFSELGIPVIDTDVIAREVVEPGESALEEIRGRFGDSVIDDSGKLDRRTLRNVVFADDDARRDLETILHPRIGAETLRQADSSPGPYQLIVVPLLANSPLLDFVDRVLVVDCDEELQVQRLMARDDETAELARKILAAQASRDDRLAIADDVIRNDQGLPETRRQVMALDKRFRRMLKNSEA